MSLHELGIKYKTDKATWHGYCEYYEKLLNKNPKIVWEIGVLEGASINMWSEFYPEAKIIGFDINDKKHLKLNANCFTELLDQSNQNQLMELSKRKNVDIILDDGSHNVGHQILTFECLFNSLKSGGQYVIEDLSTSLVNDKNGVKNQKGALQYLQDIMLGRTPQNYPGQIKTSQIIKQIKNVIIFENIHSDGQRSISSVITKV